MINTEIENILKKKGVKPTSNRLLVMKDGRVTREIRRDEDFTEQSVIGVMI